MIRGKLSLKSPLWWPMADALAHHRKQTGADTLTGWDFNDALVAGRLRAKVRRADGSHELLAASAWSADLHIAPEILLKARAPGRWRMYPGALVVWTRRPLARVKRQWFFVWKPDFENIFGDKAEPPNPPPPVREVPVERGRKPVHEWADLQSVALWLSTQRKQGAPPKINTDVVNELREWCKRNKRKVPGVSTLYTIVAAAFRLKPTLKT